MIEIIAVEGRQQQKRPKEAPANELDASIHSDISSGQRLSTCGGSRLSLSIRNVIALGRDLPILCSVTSDISLVQVDSYLRLYSPWPIRALESQRHSCPFQGQQ
jgi:hypothetical protein